MPPKKGRKTAPKAAPPLANCSIALSGTFPGQTQADLQDKITSLGGEFNKSGTAATTHLVASEADYNKPSAKVKTAQSRNVPIVSLDWLEDCLSSNIKKDEASYQFGSSSAPQTNGAVKRSASPDPDQNGAAQKQPKKKTKTAKGSQPEAKAEPEPEPEAETKDEKMEIADGQIAKSSDVKIPVDEGCQLTTYGVYIDDDGVIYDASLNQTNASANNNKFYRIQLLHDGAGDYKVWTRWGRVGEFGQKALLGDGNLNLARKEYESKFRSKTGLAWSNRLDNPKPGKYAFVEKNYNEDDEDETNEPTVKKEVKDEEAEEEPAPKSNLPAPIEELMALIFDQDYFAATMSDLNYDANKLPLGKLSKNTITRGYQALKDLAALIDDPTLAQTQYNRSFPMAVEQLSNSYYSLIPHAFGRNRPPVIRENTMLKKEIELLESLGDMKDAMSFLKPEPKDAEKVNLRDRQFKGLGMEEMTPLDPTGEEFALLKNYLMDTRGATHRANYQVSQIFRIERQGEKQRFEGSPYAGPIKDRRLLWHGSRCTNFGGILSQGLRIAPPEAPVSGYMFGKGIYLADMSSKSANYCCAHISGGQALLLLCEAELGDPMQGLTNASYTAGEDAKANGMWSTWGKGLTAPQAWKDAGAVHPSLAGVKMPDTTTKPDATNVPGAYLQYNEYITYDVAQVRLRYLFRVKM